MPRAHTRTHNTRTYDGQHEAWAALCQEQLARSYIRRRQGLVVLGQLRFYQLLPLFRQQIRYRQHWQLRVSSLCTPVGHSETGEMSLVTHSAHKSIAPVR